MHVVVVESPTKAKTVQHYLGGDYRVLATWGHVRDLPAKDGSVRPDSGFAMTYASGPRARRVLGRIRTALKNADSLILATDPDREGEAIAWQVLTWLQERGVIGERPVRRVAFHEITPEAVRAAMASPCEIDMDLVHAQQARRALDYLVGFHLSPVLWRKIPGSRSAGRVQSVALRLICEREAAIEDFMPREYWTVEAEVEAVGGTFAARLSHLDGNALGPLSQETATMAERAVERIRGGSFHVAALDRSEVRRDPPPPFTTAALQQDASRRLGIGVEQVMRIAQALYEGVTFGGETTGLITYMRKVGRRGVFVGCGRFPECRFTRPLAETADDGWPRPLGEDPKSGLALSLRRGRFGLYVQRGGSMEEAGAATVSVTRQRMAPVFVSARCNRPVRSIDWVYDDHIRVARSGRSPGPCGSR